jgi:hypothetical protein
MATFTVDGQTVVGNKRLVHGTFTTTAGDTSVSLAATTHGLNNIIDYKLELDTGGLDSQKPKISVSSGTITATFDDTEGYSGTWTVTGN